MQKGSEKVEIIPSINVSDFSEIKRRLKLVEQFVSWVHLDVSDGVFSKHVSWHESKDLIGFESKIKIEVHLMTSNPEKNIENWLMTPASRIIFHQEATRSHNLIIEKIHEAKKEAGVAIKPTTPWLKLFPYLGQVELLQVLGVDPGPSGQKLDESILHKIGHIRRICDPCIIEVDGGVNQENANAIAKEGANILVVGNAVFNSDNIENAIKKLQHVSSTRG